MNNVQQIDLLSALRAKPQKKGAKKNSNWITYALPVVAGGALSGLAVFAFLGPKYLSLQDSLTTAQEQYTAANLAYDEAAKKAETYAKTNTKSQLKEVHATNRRINDLLNRAAPWESSYSRSGLLDNIALNWRALHNSAYINNVSLSHQHSHIIMQGGVSGIKDALQLPAHVSALLERQVRADSFELTQLDDGRVIFKFNLENNNEE
ncbi:hypothetical protein [Neptuniibacter sp. QD37_11]|uniref:hypothetical protein n=1 Tax=Neptuniibacter sp. QD37_11 TaxID=3398209 RepID=UPI0039F612EB